MLSKVTCGQGASCAGQCSALGASLSPSGKCDDDNDDDVDGTCEGNSVATLQGSDLKWCLKDGCRVVRYPSCCFNPKCLEKKGRRKRCAWHDYLVGRDKKKIHYSLFHYSLFTISLLHYFTISLFHYSLFHYSGKTCPFPGSLPNGRWSCEMLEIPVRRKSFFEVDGKSFPGAWPFCCVD